VRSDSVANTDCASETAPFFSQGRLRDQPKDLDPYLPGWFRCKRNPHDIKIIQVVNLPIGLRFLLSFSQTTEFLVEITMPGFWPGLTLDFPCFPSP
jgi:hypothetical protein